MFVSTAIDDHGSDDIIHVATGNPLGVYSMSLHGPSIHHVDLGWYFPLSMRPQLSAAALHGDHMGKVLLHEHNVRKKRDRACLEDCFYVDYSCCYFCWV